MKVVELVIDELSELLGFDANSLVSDPAIQENFYAFKEVDVDDLIVTELIKQELNKHVKLVAKLPGETESDYMSRCIPVLLDEGYDRDQAVAICASEYESFDEAEDVYEIKIGDYQTRHFDMCPAASELYSKIESQELDVDMGLAIRAARLQDSLFWLEKHTVKQMQSASPEDLNSALNLAYEILLLADMMGLTDEHSYIWGHVDAIREVADKQEMDIDVAGLPDYSSEISGSRLEFESYTDYPQAASDNAARALKWAEENGWGDCGTPVGKIRANQLANREPISEETIARMSAFRRHQQNADTPYGEGCGKLMWDSWGGEEGIAWAERKLKQIREEMSAHKFSLASEDQKIVVGPLLIPNRLILRVDENGDPYHVFFSEDTVRSIAKKMMKDKLLDRLNAQHNSEDPIEGFMMSTWIIEDPKMDQANIYGFGHLPKGSWMGMYQLTDEKAWQRVKNGELRGFSIEAHLQERLVKL